MSDEVTFVDLVALSKIRPDTTAERFGGIINSSFFDAANVLGGLSQKHLINFSTTLPGPNPIVVTDTGNQLLAEAAVRAKDEFDTLDLAALVQIKNGKRSADDLSAAIGIRPRDLGMHLYKLSQQGYCSYEFRSGILSLMLTEKGFTQVTAGMPPKPAPPQQMQGQPVQGQPMQQPQAQPGPPPPQISPAMQQLEMQAQKAQQQMASQAPVADSAQPKTLTPQELEKKINDTKQQTTMIKVGGAVAAIVIIVAVLHFFMRVF